MNKPLRCGYVAVLGRPNVGKSTLMNQILAQHVSITSRKAQTTRHRILAIKTTACTQTIYVDTPGVQRNPSQALHRYLNKTAYSTVYDVDVIAFVVESLRFGQEDEWILQQLANHKIPVVLVINKVDKVADKARLLPLIQNLSGKMQFADIIPLSAKTKYNLDRFETVIAQYLPKASEFYFSKDTRTLCSDQFMSCELIREKLFRRLGQELPYSMTVSIEKMEKKPNIFEVHAIIWVERVGQKLIVVGSKGDGLKTIGTQARLAMEDYFNCKVFLRLWVKVRDGWSDDESALHTLGYVE